jgi:hypothetical protein
MLLRTRPAVLEYARLLNRDEKDVHSMDFL